MADRIHGPLNYELTGHSGPVMAFVHPNPMDQSCWLYQTTHFSTWFRCVSIDIPGYGRSPKADPGLTMDDMATACWEAIDAAYPGEDAILFGCSTGASIVPHMHNLQPERTKAIVVCGTGYNPKKEFAPRRIKAYKEYGIDLEAWSGRDHHTIAVSSAFLVDVEGVVRWAHTSLDYKTRPSPEQLIEAADGIDW